MKNKSQGGKPFLCPRSRVHDLLAARPKVRLILAMGYATEAMGQAGAVAVMTVGVVYLLAYTLKIKKS